MKIDFKYAKGLYTIEEMLKEEIPEVIKVVNVEDLNSPLLDDVER